MKNFKLPGKIIAVILCIALVAIGVIRIPRMINTEKLQALGYDEEAITAIIDKNLTKTIIDNGYYSDYLNYEVVKDSFNAKYIKLYVITNHVDDSYINLYEKLKEKKGYTDEELEQLYASLSYLELRPLLIFDKLDDIQTYISDCEKHPENTLKSYTFSNDYLKKYENVVTIEDPSSVEAFVSPKTSLGDYVPEKLVSIQVMDAINGLKLQSVALDAFSKLCNALRENGTSIYAVGAYTSYESYQALYDSAYKAYGYKGEQYVYNMIGGMPGCADDQTGLAVKVVAAETENVSDFNTTKAYAWLLEHAHEYGFIFRYPEGKEVFTGKSAQYNYLRYVGVDLATKIYESGMCFDEYYYFYMN